VHTTQEFEDIPSASQKSIKTPIHDLIMGSLEDDKAEDIIQIDLTGKTSIADSMVIASGRSTRQVAAISDHLLRKLKAAGLGSCTVEGLDKADWVLIDAGDTIIHIFRPEVRDFYNLEKMWTPDFRPNQEMANLDDLDDE